MTIVYLILGTVKIGTTDCAFERFYCYEAATHSSGAAVNSTGRTDVIVVEPNDMGAPHIVGTLQNLHFPIIIFIVFIVCYRLTGVRCF